MIIKNPSYKEPISVAELMLNATGYLVIGFIIAYALVGG